ncbi:MAG: FAD-dependent oxidoreductase [Lachnospiraceae bacterium]|nr:FAD-dependent oxidoreductase [Lachnospiraceae bacterium]
MIRITQLKLPVSGTLNDLQALVTKRLKHPKTPWTMDIIRRSLDSREKPKLYYIYSVNVSLENTSKEAEERLVERLHDRDITLVEHRTYEPKELSKEALKKYHAAGDAKPSIVIVGTGPAGLFAGLVLARAGLCPILIDRGGNVTERTKTVSEFWDGKPLSPDCNVQFGEGGAGTFSDGKLNSQIKENTGKLRFIMDTFVLYGANPEIIYDAKPHVGTDKLVECVSGIREEIISLGGKVLFHTKMTGLCLEKNRITGIEVNDREILPCSHVILAIGHSARDTIRVLYGLGVAMEQKAFAMGVRMEHPQEVINAYAYGVENASYDLPAAPYKVTYKHKESGRGVYSFCMCPGGYVVNASSEPGRLCVNGMSYSGRNSKNANSAIVVTIKPSDYAKDSNPLAGVEYQEALEEKAYEECDGKIPVQRFEDFSKGCASTSLGRVTPCIKGAYALGNLWHILPEEMIQPIIAGVHHFGKQIPSFDDGDALMVGLESRTSSPVHMLRNEHGESNIGGLYPCGEGAGYAGGITSAAVDGIRTAEWVMEDLERILE